MTLTQTGRERRNEGQNTQKTAAENEQYPKNKTHYSQLVTRAKNRTELEQIQKNYPILSPLIKNNQIKSLIQVPKYLDFSLKALETNSGDLDNVSIIELKKILWNQLVISIYSD